MSQAEINPHTLTEVVQQVSALRDLITPLAQDIDSLKNANDATGRRALVRAAFAYIEGTSFGFRTAALSLARMRGVEFEVGEVMIAREVTFTLNERGKVEERPLVSSPLANLRFALTLFAKAVGATYEFPAGDAR